MLDGQTTLWCTLGTVKTPWIYQYTQKHPKTDPSTPYLPPNSHLQVHQSIELEILHKPCKFPPFYRRINRDAELQSLMLYDWMQFFIENSSPMTLNHQCTYRFSILTSRQIEWCITSPILVNHQPFNINLNNDIY